MTQQVRDGYRRHRGATWVIALGVVAVAAAVFIPLAMAADKTYRLTASSPVCAGLAPTTTLTIRNTAGSQTLGSAEIYFPPNTVASAPPWQVRKNTTSTTSGGTKDIIALDNLNIAPGAERVITVTLNANVTFSATITAVVKQANRFNDSGGGANLFALEGSFPTLRVVQCVTVSGRVYQDRNLDNVYTTGSGAFLNSDIPKAWKVDLYAKDVGAASYPSTPFKTVNPSSATDGSFTFSQVPTGSDYKICVTAAGADALSKWALQSPTGNEDCGPISAGGPASSAANRLLDLSANASGQDFQVVPVVGPFGANSGPSTVGGYTVDAGSNSTKEDDFYVQDTWVDAQGRTNFRFSPVNVCTQNCPPGKIYLLETLVADIELSDLGGQQATLQYDDAPPFRDNELKAMPYCKIDPRQTGGALATPGDVLPGTDTSCIVEASQEVVAGEKVQAVYKVYTSYDGGRQVG